MYPERKTVLIPNGFDCDVFSPRRDLGPGLKSELGLSDTAILIGHAARYHPMKNHEGLVRAFARTAENRDDTYLVMAGRNVDVRNLELTSLVRSARLEKRVFLLGELSAIPEFLAQLDICVLSSRWGEAFPNILGEAMACGVPCVTTDVGDSGRIVGESGQIVPAGDDGALADAMSALVQAGPVRRRELGLRARQSVLERYSLKTIAQAYRQVFEDVCAGRRMRRHARGQENVRRL